MGLPTLNKLLEFLLPKQLSILPALAIGGGILAGSVVSGLMGKKGMESAAQTAADATIPYGLNTSYGGTQIGPGRELTTNVDPRMGAYQNRLFSQLGSISPDQQLSLMRQQAAPYNQAASQGLENRLFSQGRLDHSQVYDPGGAMRGLWDAQLNQDLSFQQEAQRQAWGREQQVLGNLLSSYGPEQQLISQSFGGGATAGQGALAGAQLSAAGSQIMPNLMSSLLGGATMGWAQSGFQSPFSGGGGGFTGNQVHGLYG